MTMLLDEPAIAQRILDHIDHETTDVSDRTWREPVANYRSEARLQAELERVFRRTPTPFCPSVALAKPGDFVSREAAGIPIVAVRGADGVVRAFRNACRHRGAQVACGSGHGAGFVCPYHGWTYGLDGALRHVPHEYGFPGLDKETRGLVPVHAFEHGGLVFVSQDAPASARDLTTPDELLPPGFQVISTNEQESKANWKIVAEGFMEGYHIFSTHRDTFYPVQFDNLNVIEAFGRNSRITFPYRNIQKLRGVDPAERHVGGTLTFVYHLFPNVIIATFPQRIVMAVLEPIAIDRTRTVNYTLAATKVMATDRPAVERDADFVSAGAREDRAVVESIQQSIASGANAFFEFGLFEGAIAHFHHNLHALLGEVE
ncbi:MAG TPA: aromatic ring-hydroxylating dioxygenase subunit alpha [Caulobacteraceae bacterium]|jgi:phenylpropionate dioxygenase-like ring-hydroxylating dioxygenase large terminal subunit|nr:aromatic ring-hydroxylating dioxygenase subunit alpha [Caulobacteraceae bacterium]